LARQGEKVMKPMKIKEWHKIAEINLVGKKIIKVSRGEDPQVCCDYKQNALKIHLDDGQIITSSRDEEGNGNGVFFTNKGLGMYI
jgi:hypothetical protein